MARRLRCRAGDRTWLESHRSSTSCLDRSSIAHGLLKKQIAAKLGTTERTIKAQRRSVVRKLGADSVPDVVRLVARLRDAGRVPKVASHDRSSLP
jgi:Bacterial regulatory proteins, luxR family